MAASVQMEIPDDLSTALRAAGYSAQQLSADAAAFLASGLFARKVLSLEQSARLAGMAMWEFIPFLSAQGIAVRDDDDAEVAAELEASRIPVV